MSLRNIKHILTLFPLVEPLPLVLGLRLSTKPPFSHVFRRYQHKLKIPESKDQNKPEVMWSSNSKGPNPNLDHNQNQNQNQTPERYTSKIKTSLEVTKLNTKSLVSNRYLGFLERYQTILETKFPGTLQVYRVFVIGFKDFISDVKDYLIIKKKVITSSDGLKNLTKKEIDIYFLMPKDMIRVGPVLLFSALPLAQYLVFPIAYYFPRHLLSSHFWTLQQKFEFAIENQKQKLYYYRPLLRQMQSGLDNIKDENLKKLLQNILHKLGSGSHPNVREIMTIKPVFEKDAFSLQAMHGPHVKGLCRIYGLNSYWFKRRRLYDHAYMLSMMDASLLRYGIFNLKPEDLKFACYLRGLNASNIAREDLILYLQQWMSISSSIKPHAYSLLLHLPILLGYNHPNNWVLLK